MAQPMIEVVVDTRGAEFEFNQLVVQIPRTLQTIIKRSAAAGEKHGKEQITQADRIDTGRMRSGYRPRFGAGGRIATLTSRVTSSGGRRYFQYQEGANTSIPSAEVTSTVARRLPRDIGRISKEELEKVIKSLERQAKFRTIL